MAQVECDAKIPVVDLNTPNASQELLDAATKFGFIYVLHDRLVLPSDDVDAMFHLVSTQWAPSGSKQS